MAVSISVYLLVFIARYACTMISTCEHPIFCFTFSEHRSHKRAFTFIEVSTWVNMVKNTQKTCVCVCLCIVQYRGSFLAHKRWTILFFSIEMTFKYAAAYLLTHTKSESQSSHCSRYATSFFSIPNEIHLHVCESIKCNATTALLFCWNRQKCAHTHKHTSWKSAAFEWCCCFLEFTRTTIVDWILPRSSTQCDHRMSTLRWHQAVIQLSHDYKLQLFQYTQHQHTHFYSHRETIIELFSSWPFRRHDRIL